MKHRFNFVNSELEKIQKNNLFRKMHYGSVNGAYITINGKKLLNLCSNDYLAIPTGPLKIKQMQSSSRLVSGNDKSFKILEQKLAKHKSQRSALVFPTGYMANIGTIPTLIQKNDLVLSDELNHTSIIQSCRLSRAKVSIYKHNNIEDMTSKLKKQGKRKFIITEGIFSMDGDFAKLKQIAEIADKNEAVIILDDAHGDFTVGKDGMGTANHFGIAKKIDVYISSLSKGLGSFGGYVASQKNIIDLFINKSKSFIYTSALPSFLVEYSLKRFESNREKQRKKLWKNVKLVTDGFDQLGYEFNSPTHIIPIIIGHEKIAMDFGKYLLNKGIFAQPIRFPTVPRNKARIRISVTAWLKKNHINKALDVFELAAKKFKIM